MKPSPFEYYAPSSVEEAVRLLRELEDEDPKCLAGGQSLVPLLNLRLARPGHLIDLNRIDGLSGIHQVDEGWRVGALTRHAEIEDSADLAARFPLLPQVARHIGYRAIRTRGTVGGAMCHADPVAEWPLVARLLDAELDVVGGDGPRQIGAADFFVTVFTPDLEADEVLRSVFFPLPAGRWATGFSEFARKTGDYAIVAAGVLLEVEGRAVRAARVAFSGVATTPYRSEPAERALAGAALDDAAAFVRAAEEAAEAAEPMSDLHGSADYRRVLMRAQLRRALSDASTSFGGEG